MASEEDPTGQIRGAAFDLGIEGYEDTAVIGRGGFAVVYRARQRSFNRTVALKVLSGAELDDAAKRRFDRERAAIGALSGHPNIVTVYDSGFTGIGVPYLAMEYLARGSLADTLHRDGPMPWQSVVSLGVKLAGALETAHRHGVLHRDIKPENVLSSNFGEPKLADFGIAQVTGGPETRSARLELSILHAAPEIVDGRKATTESDIYSLASTLFTLIAGRPPFLDEDDESLVRLLVRIGTAPLPDLAARGLPPSLQAVFETAMAKDPEERYGTALALGHALQRVQEGAALVPTPLPVEDAVEHVQHERRSAPPTEALTPTAKSEPEPMPAVAAGGGRRRPLVRVGVVVAVVVAVAAGLVVALHDQPASRSVTHAGPTSLPTVASTTAPTVPAVSTLPAHAGQGLLPAGVYTTGVFSPQLTLLLGAGWRLERDQTATSVELGRPGDARDFSLNFYVVDQIINPATAPANETDVAAAAQPLDLSAAPQFLAGHQRLNAQASGSTASGTVSGTAVDFIVKDGYHYGAGQCARTPCVLLFRHRPNIVAAYQGDMNRFYLFPVNGTLVLATVVGPPDQFQRLLPEAERIIGGAL